MDRNNLNDYPYFEDAHDDYGEARSDYRRASAPNPAQEQPRYADYGAQAARMASKSGAPSSRTAYRSKSGRTLSAQ